MAPPINFSLAFKPGADSEGDALCRPPWLEKGRKF